MFREMLPTVAHPILCAMGLETAVIPTAVLSTHTYQFKDYTFRDLTSDIPAIATHWKSLNLQFDGIYTGYLGSQEQVQIVSDFSTHSATNTPLSSLTLSWAMLESCMQALPLISCRR